MCAHFSCHYQYFHVVNNAFHSDKVAHCVPQRFARRRTVSVTWVYDASARDALFQLADAVLNLRFRSSFAVGPSNAVGEQGVSSKADILLRRIVAHRSWRVARSMDESKVGRTQSKCVRVVYVYVGSSGERFWGRHSEPCSHFWSSGKHILVQSVNYDRGFREFSFHVSGTENVVEMPVGDQNQFQV